MSQHSPAPFRIGQPLRDERNGGEYRTIKSAVGGWIADVRCGSSMEQANCELFMAAPDLVQACRELITAMVQLDKEHHREVSAARAALGKAGAK